MCIYVQVHVCACVQVAVELVLASTEFHTTSRNELTPTERPQRDSSATNSSNEDYKAIVVIFLYGGLDSYNMLVPYGDCAGGVDLYQEYRDVRTNVALERSELDEIDVASGSQPCAKYGVHGFLQEVTRLYNKGQAAFVANYGQLVEPVTKAQYYDKGSVALPPNLFSHNTQQRHWHTVDPTNANSLGVLGKIVDSLVTQEPPMRAGGYSTAGATRMLRSTFVPPDIIDPDIGVVRFSAYNRLKEYIDNMTRYESRGAFSETYSAALQEMLARTEVLGETLDSIELDTDFGGSNLDKQFEQVAKLVKSRDVSGNEREVFFVSRGGFDMHNEVITAMENRMGEISTALASFVEEMEAQGLWDKVVVCTSSDFARTLTSNGRGTDHAWGGNGFVAGGKVKGGQMFGHYPDSLAQTGARILSRGRAIPTTPVDAMWNAVASWFGLSDENIGWVLPNIKNFNSSDLIEESELFHP